MTVRKQFDEEIRQLSVIDQKSGSLLNGTALLFAGTTISDLAEIPVLASCGGIIVGILQGSLLFAAFMALRAGKMMGKFENWPNRDKPLTDEQYQEAVDKIAAVVRNRRFSIDISWYVTIVCTAIMALLILLRTFF